MTNPIDQPKAETPAPRWRPSVRAAQEIARLEADLAAAREERDDSDRILQEASVKFSDLEGQLAAARKRIAELGHAEAERDDLLESQDAMQGLIDKMKARAQAAEAKLDAEVEEWQRKQREYDADYEQLEAERDEVLLKDRGKTNEINILVKENRELSATLERYKAALEEIRRWPPTEGTEGSYFKQGFRQARRVAIDIAAAALTEPHQVAQDGAEAPQTGEAVP